MTAVHLAGDLLSIVVLAHGAWWTFLCLLAVPRPRAAQARARTTRVVAIVPAHNEAAHIAACVQSLQAAARIGQDEILVVADNCTDETAAIARHLGASVIERQDPARRGKSYALEFAISHLSSRAVPPDAVAFVDADSTVSASFFAVMSGALNRGASVVQVHYAAAAGASQLGRLRALAFLLIHWSRPLGASRLGLATSLKGNGMAMRWDVARDGLGAAGLAEDAAMTLSLARRGIPVRYEPRATVTGFMAQEYVNAAVQDDRWERGRLGLIGKALATAARATVRGQLAVASSAMEVGSLPLSLLLGASLVTLVPAMMGLASMALSVAAMGSLGTYVVIGLVAARADLRDVAALATAPRFLLHKARIYLRVAFVRKHTGWERTDRG